MDRGEGLSQTYFVNVEGTKSQCAPLQVHVLGKDEPPAYSFSTDEACKVIQQQAEGLVFEPLAVDLTGDDNEQTCSSRTDPQTNRGFPNNS